MHSSEPALTTGLPAWWNRRILVTLMLGFASGLPLSLSGGTLQAWFASDGVDIRAIGWASLVGLPYVFKFLWAPFMDRFVPPWLGRRRGWILLCQLALVVLIIMLGALSPAQQLPMMLALALLLAFLSASQDIAVDAYRADLLPARERGLGAAVAVGGYRTALLCTGAGALILADQIGWQFTYWLMAGLMLIGLIGSWIGPNPLHAVQPPASLHAAIVDPFRDFLTRERALLLLLFIVLYKLGDAFAGTLTVAFLIQGLGFSTTDVGLVSQAFGWVATVGGALFGGLLMLRLRLFRALMLFGLLQAITNLGFVALALAGPHYLGMVIVVGLENLAGGMGTAAFVALLMALCNARYTATQFALLSALAAVGRVLVGPPAGQIVHLYGWAPFFMLTFLLAIPALILLWYLRGTIGRYENNHT